MPKRKPPFAWDEYRDRILASIDFRSEFLALGLDLAPSEPNDAGWLPCHAFDRKDETPSAAVNLTTGAYVDHGGDGRRLGFFDLAAATGKFVNWQAARDCYAARASIEMHGAPPPKSPAENLDFQPWDFKTDLQASLWCLKKVGVTVPAIKAAGGRFARYFGKYTVIALPIWGPGFLQVDPVGWVAYNTTGLALPVYHGKDRAATWVKVKTTSASGPGLIGMDALKKIQDWKPGMPPLTIFKVEGPSDCLALWAAIDAWRKVRELAGVKPENYLLVLTNAGGAKESASGPKSWMLTPFTGHNVIVVGDADRPGREGSERWAAAIARVAASVRVVKLPYPEEEKHGKDVRDFLNEKTG